MEVINNCLAEDVRSGKYYSSAINWYLHKYVTPAVERSIIALFVIIFVIIMLIVAIRFSNLSTINPQVNYITSPRDISQYSSFMRSLSTNLEPKLALAEYLSTTYLINRESYSGDTLKNNVLFIMNHSTPEVYSVYRQYISINNPKSPVFIYGKNKRTVKIISREIIKINNTPFFVIKFRTFINQKLQNQEWQVKIGFSMSTVKQLIENKDSKVDFRVNKYIKTPA